MGWNDWARISSWWAIRRRDSLRKVPVAMVGGGLLWGLWILLWRSTALGVLVSGLFWPLLLWWLAGKWRVGLGPKPTVWYRWDLWLCFWGLFLLGVLKGVVRTGFSVIVGRHNPGIVAVPLWVRSDLSRLLLILAITASPGTIALLAEGEFLYVHCLRLPRSAELPGVGRLQRVLAALAG